MKDQRDLCIYCGARALRDSGGRIISWAVSLGLNGAGHHDHETINGES